MNNASRFATFIFLFLAASLTSGCSWFVIGGAVAGWLYLDQDDSSVVYREPDPFYVDIEEMSPSTNGLIYIPYRCIGVQGQEVSLAAEYRIEGEDVWRHATHGPGTSPLAIVIGPGGTEQGIFSWDTKRDCVYSKSVVFRLMPCDHERSGTPGNQNLFVGNGTGDAWVERTPMPTARQEMGCAASNGKIYVVGGWGSGELDAMEEFDPASNTWRTLAPMPTARVALSSAAVNGIIYAVGGDTHPDNYLDIVERYDPIQNSWDAVQRLPSGRTGLSCVGLDGKVYAMGGYYYDGADHLLSDLDVYDPLTDTWTSKAPMPFSGAWFTACATGGCLYVFGLQGSNVCSYDPPSDTWTVCSPLPGVREDFSCAALGGRIYLIGGDDDTRFVTPVWEYDPVSDSWRTLSDFLHPRSNLSAAAVNGKIYAFGGDDGMQVARVTEYEPRGEQWEVMPDLTISRYSPACEICGGKIFIIGGYQYSSSTYLDSIEEYDIHAKTWTSKTPMAAGRSDAASVLLNGKIYVLGGEDAGSSYLDQVEAYDVASDTWTLQAPLPTPRSGLTAETYGGRIYAFGGYDQAFDQNQLESYDPVSDTWVVLKDMPTPRWALSSAVVGRGIYVIGGHDMWANAAVEIYWPESDTWSTGLSLPTARGRLSCVEIDGDIFALGGHNGTYYVGVNESYSTARGAWSNRTVMSVGRGLFSTAALHDRVYAVGGITIMSGDGELMDRLLLSRAPLLSDEPDLLEGRTGANCLSMGGKVLVSGGGTSAEGATVSMQCRDLISDMPADGPFTAWHAWTALQDASARRRKACAFEAGGSLYVVGGFDASTSPLDSMERYDPVTDTWTSMPPMPTARGGMGVAVLENEVFLFGGEISGGAKTGVVEVYDTLLSTWTTAGFAPLSTPRSHFGFTSIQGRIYAFGGEGNGGAFLDAGERYDPRMNAWQSVGSLPHGVKGCLCLVENGHAKLFGGEIEHPTASSVMTNRILVYDHKQDQWRLEDARLPYAARDMFGCTSVVQWSQRGTVQQDEFCFLGGGFDGSVYRDDFFRYMTR